MGPPIGWGAWEVVPWCSLSTGWDNKHWRLTKFPIGAACAGGVLVASAGGAWAFDVDTRKGPITPVPVDVDGEPNVAHGPFAHDEDVNTPGVLVPGFEGTEFGANFGAWNAYARSAGPSAICGVTEIGIDCPQSIIQSLELGRRWHWPSPPLVFDE